jgi:CRP-like cAMP-binding protein
MTPVEDALLWSRLWPSEVPSALTEALARSATPRRLRHGEWLYARGDTAAGLIGVRRGMIRYVHLAAEGREWLFGLFPAGSWFGELSLFDEAPRPLHAIAEGETEVLVVPAAAFHAVLDAHPEGYRLFTRVLSRKLRVALDQLADFQRPLRQRLVRRLLDLAAVYGRAEPDGLKLDLALPQDELARMLGATRQSINKELRALMAEGLIIQQAGRLRLRELATLKALVGP